MWFYDQMKMKIGDFVTSMGKSGIVTDVLTSENGEQSFIRLVSPDLITRNANGLAGELVDLGAHVIHCEKEVVIKAVDDYVKMLEDRIAKLKEFGEAL